MVSRQTERAELRLALKKQAAVDRVAKRTAVQGQLRTDEHA